MTVSGKSSRRFDDRCRYKHRPDQPLYHCTKSIKLPTASNSSAELINYALYVLKQIFMTGLIYAKAGVIVTGIIPANQITVDLFDTADRTKLIDVSRMIDNYQSTVCT